MSRWEPNARGRLEQAALDLYQERGFEQTTVAEIAERAGLTERTFFRYFADKREVLFWGQGRLHEIVVNAVASQPVTASPFNIVVAALEAMAAAVPDRPEFLQQRQAVIAQNPELQERELLKMASLIGVITEALQQRGIPGPTVRLLVETGIAVYRVAFTRWVDEKEKGPRTLPQLLREALDELKAVLAF
ncbi:MAG: TetR family transcriptional regulator [Chloroflexi bacterium]|nr:TetR family transcriptional regulator [Chloroflexota bacterium]OJV92789.1 MAG: TetR family transcriptional regulator [Chloroflexi bacterium 54-19]